MDDYIEPKDSKKLQLGVHTSPLSTNHYSDDDDDDDYRYSQPYHSVPGPGGRPVGKTGAGLGPDQDADDGYEIVPDQLPLKTKTLFDYDVPPAPRKSFPGADQGAPTPALKPSISMESPDSPEDYFRLKYNGTSAVQAGRGKSVVSENEQLSDGEDSYNHTSSWLTQKTERQKSSGSSNPPPSPVKPASGTPFATRTAANRQNSNGSLSGTSPVFKTSAFKSPPPQQESAKTFTRQRAIHPRKSSSGVADAEAGSQPSSGPAIYEEAWDTAQQQRRLEENLRLARSISACSDTFEDALEFLPEDWTPSKGKAGSRKTQDSGRTGPRTVDPVTGGEYEPAWDLNRGLEEKLRSLQAAHPESGEGAGGDGNYQEPWDLAQKQRELEKKIERARAEGGRGNARSPQQQQQQQQQSSGGGELYEMPWDTKKGLAHMLQSSQSVEGQRSLSGSYVAPFSPKPSQSVSGAIGEPINAMIPLNNQEWYHGNISRDDAERMLRVCKDGSYLVRDSSDRCHYTLSIKSAIQTIHIQIDQCQKADGSMRYILGKNSKAFQTIPSMIDHYTHHIVPIKGAEHMTLLYPVHCKYSGGEESQV